MVLYTGKEIGRLLLFFRIAFNWKSTRARGTDLGNFFFEFVRYYGSKTSSGLYFGANPWNRQSEGHNTI